MMMLLPRILPLAFGIIRTTLFRFHFAGIGCGAAVTAMWIVSRKIVSIFTALFFKEVGTDTKIICWKNVSLVISRGLLLTV